MARLCRQIFAASNMLLLELHSLIMTVGEAAGKYSNRVAGYCRIRRRATILQCVLGERRKDSASNRAAADDDVNCSRSQRVG